MIYDMSGNILNVGSLDIVSGESRDILCQIDGKAGKILRAEITGDLQITAKQTDQPDFTDLETTGLDLTEFDGSREGFVIRLTAAPDILTVKIKALRIYVDTL